jgi:hypothetical protein
MENCRELESLWGVSVILDSSGLKITELMEQLKLTGTLFANFMTGLENFPGLDESLLPKSRMRNIP